MSRLPDLKISLLFFKLLHLKDEIDLGKSVTLSKTHVSLSPIVLVRDIITKNKY